MSQLELKLNQTIAVLQDLSADLEKLSREIMRDPVPLEGGCHLLRLNILPESSKIVFHFADSHVGSAMTTCRTTVTQLQDLLRTLPAINDLMGLSTERILSSVGHHLQVQQARTGE
jgi:hypothetical protein